MKKKKKKTARRKSAAGGHDRELREHLVALLKGGGAHVHFMDAIDGFPEAQRGAFIESLPHSGWQLVEHVRLAQWDILEFSRNPKHKSPGFPEGYWPKTPVPPNDAAWDNCVNQFQHDLKEMIKLVKKSADRLVRKDSARRRADNSAPSAGAGGSQLLPPGTTGGFAARAGSLAGAVEKIGPEQIHRLQKNRRWTSMDYWACKRQKWR